MASGSGKNHYSIQTKEVVDLLREESNAAAAELPLPAPPSERFQEWFRGAPEAGAQSPSAATVVEAAAAAKRKGKETVDPSRRSSAGGRSPLSPRPMSHSEAVARARRKRTIDMKAVYQRAEANELRSELMDQFSDRTGKSEGNYTIVNPHVSYQTFKMSGIIGHYNLLEMVAGRGEFGSNALNFCRAYSEFRPVHGDGECFYRSFIFSYLEQVLDRQDTHEEHHLLAAVKEVAMQHARLGWASEFSRSHKAFKKLIKKVIRWKAHSRWKHGPTTNSYGQEKLLEFFSSYDSTNEIFTFLRLVAAIWICSHSEEFQQAVPELSEGYTLIDWCFEKVIHHKVFTDQVQITAVVRALGVPLRVEYLFQEAGQEPLYTGISQNDMPRSTCWPCHRHRQPPNYEVPLVTLLYTNQHYDIIYPDQRCSQQIAQFTKRRDRAKAVQALVPASVQNGSYASAVGAAVRIGWLVFLSVCNSVLSWIAGCCFYKRGRPQAPYPEFSWLSVMGSPIINSDSSCTISACTMCIEAQHRLVFERLNGRGSFTFKAKVPAELKKTCYRKGVWNSEDGAGIGPVLQVIAAKGGVMTQRVPNNIKLQIDGFFVRDIDNISGHQLMRIIYAHGPIIGSLFVDYEYYGSTTGENIYRGVREEFKTPEYGDYHAIVCFGYKFDKRTEELYIHIMDNHTEQGPLRWSEFSAFQLFVVPLVTKPVELHQLRRKRGKEKHGIQVCLSEWKKNITLWLIRREMERYYRYPRAYTVHCAVAPLKS